MPWSSPWRAAPWWSTSSGAPSGARWGRWAPCQSATTTPSSGPQSASTGTPVACPTRRWPTASAAVWPQPAGRSTTTGPRPPTGATRWRCWRPGRSSGSGARHDRAPERRGRLPAAGERRRPHRRRCAPDRQPAARVAGSPGAARRQERVRAGRVRLVLGAGRRGARGGLPRTGRGRGRLRDHHRRGAGAGRRRARRRRPRRVRSHRRPAGDGRGRRGAVRLLHARLRGRRPRPARPRPATRPARRARGARRQPLPMHRLRPHPGRGRARGGGADGSAGMTGATDVQAPPAGGGSAGAHVGDSPIRPDGTPKVQGRFPFASDLQAEGMLWGRTLRSPHPYARVRSIDVGPALAIPGVSCVLTADDLPGAATYGLMTPDQPVFARDVVRFVGEAVAAVAADHPDTARRALQAVVVGYEPLAPLVDPAAARTADPIPPDGNVIRP